MAMDFIVLALIFHKKICFEKNRIISDNRDRKEMRGVQR
jgi:hypothetical protein